MSVTVDKHERRRRAYDDGGNRRGYLDVRRDQHEIAQRELQEQFGDDKRIDVEDDPIAWRRKIRQNPAGALAWRIGIFVVGLVPIVAGIPMVPLVGPGWAVIFVGLFLWSTEFIWARRVTQFIKAEVRTFNIWYPSLPWKAKVPIGVLTVVFCWLCFYVVLLLLGVPDWTPEPVKGWLESLPGLG